MRRNERFRYCWLHLPTGIRGADTKAFGDTSPEALNVAETYEAACVAVNHWNLGGGDWVYWIDPNDYYARPE